MVESRWKMTNDQWMQFIVSEYKFKFLVGILAFLVLIVLKLYDWAQE